MFHYFKKSILFFLFVSILPSTYAMENNTTSWLGRIYASFSLPFIPSELFGYQIRNPEKQNNLKTKKTNTDSDKELSIANKILDIDKDKLENFKQSYNFNNAMVAAVLSVSKSVYKENINKALLETVNNIQKNNGTNEEDWKKVKQCVQCGADPNLKTGPKKETPLLLVAIQSKRADLVNCLLQRGADPNIHDEETKYTPLYGILCSSSDWEVKKRSSNWDQGKLVKIAMEILENLLQHYANPNAEIPLFGNIPLDTAMNYNDTRVFKLLIKHGVNVSRRNSLGNTLLATKIIVYDYNKMKTLCTLGALLTDIDSEGNTAFHSMVEHDYSKETFETVITCARPPQIEHNKRNAIQRTVRAAIWALKYDHGESNFSILSDETRLYILSMFPEKYFNNSNGALHWALYKTVLPAELPIHYEQSYLLGKARERVLWLADILKTKNKNGKTAFQKLFACEDQNYINEIEPLLDESKLIDDYNLLIENPAMLNDDYLKQNPDKTEEVKKNLALKIANNIKSEIVYINK